MKSSNELHNAYNDLYREIRQYIWSIRTVQLLAALEIETYKAFPDVSEVQRCYDALHRDIVHSLDRDEDSEDLYKSMESFENTLKEADTIYNDIYTVKEVLVNENNEESEESDNEEGEWLDEPEESDEEANEEDSSEIDTF